MDKHRLSHITVYKYPITARHCPICASSIGYSRVTAQGYDAHFWRTWRETTGKRSFFDHLCSWSQSWSDKIDFDAKHWSSHYCSHYCCDWKRSRYSARWHHCESLTYPTTRILIQSSSFNQPTNELQVPASTPALAMNDRVARLDNDKFDITVKPDLRSTQSEENISVSCLHHMVFPLLLMWVSLLSRVSLRIPRISSFGAILLWTWATTLVLKYVLDSSCRPSSTASHNLHRYQLYKMRHRLPYCFSVW